MLAYKKVLARLGLLGILVAGSLLMSNKAFATTACQQSCTMGLDSCMKACPGCIACRNAFVACLNNCD
jgi:hypothetical protein